MEVRHYKRDDAGSVLELWNIALQKDKADTPWYVELTLLNEERLKDILASPNHDPKGAFVASEGGRIVGFARGVVKRVKTHDDEDLDELPGFLEALMVADTHRRRGIGTALLERIESFVRSAGKKAVKFSRYRSPIAGVCVLPDTPEYHFLVRNGFHTEGGTEMRLKLDFTEFRMKPDIELMREQLHAEGIEIKYYEKGHSDSLSKLMAKHFSGWWHFAYRPNLKSDKPKPVLIAVYGDQVVGFVGFVHVSENGQAGFSPGVDPDYRNRGIGKVLVNVWAEEVKKLGARGSIISTGSRNIPAQRIYFGMGYKKAGEFWPDMIKVLTYDTNTITDSSRSR